MSDSNSYSRLRVFPADDAAFNALVKGAFDRVGNRGLTTPLDLETALRVTYPHARVRVQDQLGMNGNIRPYWYVFRDGRIVPTPRTT